MGYKDFEQSIGKPGAIDLIKSGEYGIVLEHIPDVSFDFSIIGWEPSCVITHLRCQANPEDPEHPTYTARYTVGETLDPENPRNWIIEVYEDLQGNQEIKEISNLIPTDLTPDLVKKLLAIQSQTAQLDFPASIQKAIDIWQHPEAQAPYLEAQQGFIAVFA